jgi:hypothetical protein
MELLQIVDPYTCLLLPAGVIAELLTCTAGPAGGQKGGTRVLETLLRADVAVPLLELSRRAVEFRYLHKQGQPAQPMQKPLHIK